MAFKYATVLVKNPKTKLREVRARAVSDKVGIRQLMKDITAETTLTSTDVKACIESFQRQVVRNLQNGDAVNLGDLGTIYPTLRSDAATKEDSFNPAMIRGVMVRFRPAHTLKGEINAELSYTKTATKKAQAAANKAATEAQNAALRAQAEEADDGE